MQWVRWRIPHPPPADPTQSGRASSVARTVRSSTTAPPVAPGGPSATGWTWYAGSRALVLPRPPARRGRSGGENMSEKRTEQGAAEPAPKAVAIGKPEDREPEGQTSLSQVGGSKSRVFNKTVLNAALSALWLPSWLPEKSRHDQQVAALHAMMAFEPADEIEGMIAAQAVAMHYGALECFRRSMIPEQSADVAA